MITATEAHSNSLTLINNRVQEILEDLYEKIEIASNSYEGEFSTYLAVKDCAIPTMDKVEAKLKDLGFECLLSWEVTTCTISVYWSDSKNKEDEEDNG